MGADFDFTALTEVDDTVREEILEELPTETVAEGVRELDSDDAVAILQDLPKEEQAEILDQLPARASASRSRAASTIPRIPPAGACRTSSLPSAPIGPLGRPSTTCARRPICPIASGNFMSSTRIAGSLARLRSIGCCAPSVRSRCQDLSTRNCRRVRATEDQEEVARLFERYDLVAAPVVDAQDRLVGVVTVRRYRRRHRGGGRRGHQGARRRARRGRALGFGLDHRARAGFPGCLQIC